MILSVTGSSRVDTKTVHIHPLYRFNNKMNKFVLGNPVAKVRRQKKGLVWFHPINWLMAYSVKGGTIMF